MYVFIPVEEGVELMKLAMRSPLMMEGPKTIAGEKGTVSERSFVMVSFTFQVLIKSRS
jgi:hypothetical protein